MGSVLMIHPTKNNSSLASSVTDIDSDDGVDITKDEEQIATYQTKTETQLKRNSSIPSISIEEAIGICNFPRLVIAASAPYKTVFVNAAYGSLTKLSSSETLGKSITKLISSLYLNKVTLESYAVSSNQGKDTPVFLFCGGEKSRSVIKCNMQVTLIVSQSKSYQTTAGYNTTNTCNENKVDSITHFAIDFPNLTDLSETSNNEGMQSRENRVFPPLQVVG